MPAPQGIGARWQVMKFKQLRALEPNWDSYGAPRINEQCIVEAQRILARLDGEWEIVPCSSGGVQLEQYANGLEIEITIDPAQLATYI